MDILFSDITAVTMDGPVLSDAYVGVEGGKICYVSGEPPRQSAGRVIDGRRRVLIPGLVNAHTHIAMTALRGYADDCRLQDWLFRHIFPAERKLTARLVYHASRLGMLEALACGTTAIADGYFFTPEVARAAAECGIKLNTCNMITCFEETYDPHSDSAMRELRELLAEYGKDADGQIVPDVGIHAVYTSNEQVWRYAAQFAAENGLRIQLHLSETEQEQTECVDKYGATPAQMFLKAGVFDSPVCAAHCVWLSDGDMDILSSHGAAAVHNPVSNAKLASGVARVPELLRRGVTVALGTDGAASNNNLDLFEEMKLAALLPKLAARDASVLPAAQALRMATEGGARALGREKSCGRIAPGLDADLAMLDFDRPHLTPCYDAVSNLVYAARGSDVVMTMVRGRVLYENGEFTQLDAGRVMREFREAAEPVFGIRRS